MHINRRWRGHGKLFGNCVKRDWNCFNFIHNCMQHKQYINITVDTRVHMVTYKHDNSNGLNNIFCLLHRCKLSFLCTNSHVHWYHWLLHWCNFVFALYQLYCDLISLFAALISSSIVLISIIFVHWYHCLLSRYYRFLFSVYQFYCALISLFAVLIICVLLYVVSNIWWIDIILYSIHINSIVPWYHCLLHEYEFLIVCCIDNIIMFYFLFLNSVEHLCHFLFPWHHPFISFQHPNHCYHCHVFTTELTTFLSCCHLSHPPFVSIPFILIPHVPTASGQPPGRSG